MEGSREEAGTTEAAGRSRTTATHNDRADWHRSEAELWPSEKKDEQWPSGNQFFAFFFWNEATDEKTRSLRRQLLRRSDRGERTSKERSDRKKVTRKMLGSFLPQHRGLWVSKTLRKDGKMWLQTLALPAAPHREVDCTVTIISNLASCSALYCSFCLHFLDLSLFGSLSFDNAAPACLRLDLPSVLWEPSCAILYTQQFPPVLLPFWVFCLSSSLSSRLILPLFLAQLRTDSDRWTGRSLRWHLVYRPKQDDHGKVLG